MQDVWGMSAPLVTVELLTAISHSGGYVAAAFDHDRMVGASVGFLADHHGEPALHSHVTGVSASMRHAGIGRAIKLHQRAWAAERGLAWITWTFDPLVRRNAWFNIALLGADVDAYLPSFYGEMTDAINAGDDSDRLLDGLGRDTPIPAAPRDGSDVDRRAAGPDASRHRRAPAHRPSRSAHGGAATHAMRSPLRSTAGHRVRRIHARRRLRDRIDVMTGTTT